MSTLIELESVSKRYGARTVVDGVSFAVRRGEILGFLGPNGAGKTTTLRMIAGVITPSAGRVSVAGFDMATANQEAARRIGYVPEHPPLYDALDVASYLRFVARAKGVPRAAMRSELERVAAVCHLEDVFHKEAYKLSKGYRQRLGFAQALLGKPDVLLLDEPTSGLDPGQIQETREAIRAHGEGHAVLLSTHILSEVTMVCQRVAIIHRGKLLAIDSPEGLRRSFEATDCVALQVAAPAEGLLDTLRSIDGVTAVQLRPVSAPSGAQGAVIDAECQVSARQGVEAAVARAVAARWQLLHLERRQPTLENVFLSYIKAGNA